MADRHPEPELCVGLDVGTSAVKLVVIEAISRHGDGGGGQPPLFSGEQPVHYRDSTPEGHRTQDPLHLFAAVKQLLQSVPPALQRRVSRVGIAGQMHGCVLWDVRGQPLTDVVTWEDQRCTPDFLSELHRSTGGYVLHSGYGCATLAWLAAAAAASARGEHRPADGGALDFARVAGCGTAMEFIGIMLTQGDPAAASWGVARMHCTNAQSWGLFRPDAAGGSWDGAALDAAGIPRRIMPELVEVGADDDDGDRGGVVGTASASGLFGDISVEVGHARAAIVVHVAVSGCRNCCVLCWGRRLVCKNKQEA
jgi:sedoheptulokinase